MAYMNGINVTRSKGGAPFSGGANTYRIENAYATALFAGDPVKVSAGYVELGVNTGTITGVFLGVSYIDGLTLRPVEQNYWTASTSASPTLKEGHAGPYALVADDPNIRMIIQANVSIPITQNGTLARISGAGAGSTVTGRSTARLDTTGTAVSAGNAMFRIVGVPYMPLAVSAGASPGGSYFNTWDVANTWVEAVWSNHAHG